MKREVKDQSDSGVSGAVQKRGAGDVLLTLTLDLGVPQRVHDGLERQFDFDCSLLLISIVYCGRSDSVGFLPGYVHPQSVPVGIKELVWVEQGSDP